MPENYLTDGLCKLLSKKQFPSLYKRFCAEIMQFLQESENRILFLELPIEELTNTVKNQDSYWSELCDVVALALRLSLTQERMEPATLSYPGNWYKAGDTFLLIPNDDDNEPYYFLSGVSINGNLRFIRQPKSGRGPFAPTKQQKHQIITSARAIYRLKCIPEQLRKGFNECKNEISQLESVSSSNSSYASGLFIYSSKYENCISAGKYILPIVMTANASETVRCASDVVVILGDKAFGRIQSSINALSPYGPVKKLIVIGSQPTQILLQNNPQIVTLTFKDINSYCAPKNTVYYTPEFVSIDFPWLKDSMSNLHGILEKYIEQIGGDNAKYIYNFSRKVLADINFTHTRLSNFKECFIQFVDSLLVSMDNNEAFSELETWCEGLTYESTSNPKQYYAREKGAVKMVDLKHSIPNQVKGIQQNGALIVVDAPLHKRDPLFANPITTVMRFHSFARVQGLYYDGVESDLMKYSQSNLNHDSLYVSSTETVTETETNEPGSFRLEDYLDQYDNEPNFIGRTYAADRIRFTDGRTESISGDVLVCDEDETLKRIQFSKMNNPSGETIVYYSQNSDNSELFDCLVNTHYKLPKGKDVEYYSNLWQDALSKLSKNFDKEAKNQFCKDMGISSAILDNHLRGRSKFMRKKSLDKILNLLIEKGLIEKTDAEYVKAARNFMNGKNISFGSQLKDALFNYKMNNDVPAFLQNLINQSGLTIEELDNKFLYTGTIK